MVCSLMACGLSVQGSGEDPAADGGPSQDAMQGDDGSSSSRADGDVSPPLADAGDNPDVNIGDCALVFEDSFVNQSASWDRLGSAQFQSGHVSLTQKSAGAQAGAIWWKPQITFTGFLRVVIDVTTDAQNVTPGDGIAVAWVSSAYSLGATGQNFGLCNSGMNGFAVAADTLDAKLLLIASVNDNCGTNDGVFSANAVGASRILAEIRADSLTGRLDTSAIHSRTLTIPKTGALGITASTGNGTAEHAITAIRVASCPL